MGAPGFWDDQQQAARISTEHARATARLDRYRRLNGEVEEAGELFELDPSLEDELRAQLIPIAAVVGAVEERVFLEPGELGGDRRQLRTQLALEGRVELE